MLAEDKYDKKLYAVKVLKKRFIIDNDEIERYETVNLLLSYLQTVLKIGCYF
jgi:hypothetical protein